ncbi:hypothetical protein TNCV_1019361 [Trichonephila clavipes]|nr:hypothetical protein TNCV_1019361 [Trichonephila clavipes]
MLCRLVGTTAPIMIVQFRNEKISNHGSIPITIDCNVVAFIVFEEGIHQPIKRTKHLIRILECESSRCFITFLRDPHIHECITSFVLRLSRDRLRGTKNKKGQDGSSDETLLNGGSGIFMSTPYDATYQRVLGTGDIASCFTCELRR